MTDNLEAASKNTAVNPIADAEKPVDTSAFGKLPFVKDVVGAQQNASKGDLDAAKANIESYVMSAVQVATDPMSFLVGTGVEFVINFVTPVRDAIQLVTGDSEALTAGSKAFDAVRKDLDGLATELTQTLDSELKDWHGEAADALRNKMGKFIEGVQNTGGQAHNIAELLEMSSTMMEAAEGVIKGILKDFLTWAIMTWVPAIAAAGPTFGGSTAAATAATTAEAGITCARTAQQVQKIIRIIQMIADVIMAIKAAIDLYRVVDSVNDITDGKKGGDPAASAASKGLKWTGAAAGGAKNVATGYQRPSLDATKEGGETVNKKGEFEEYNPDDPKKYTGAEFGRSVATNAAASLGTAADKLDKQAKEGGFSDVPSDKSISGELDV